MERGCRFYVQGDCFFLKKHQNASPPSLARVRRPKGESLTDVLEGGPRLTGNRSYGCAARFSLDRQGFQGSCEVAPLQLGAAFGIIYK